MRRLMRGLFNLISGLSLMVCVSTTAQRSMHRIRTIIFALTLIVSTVFMIGIIILCISSFSQNIRWEFQIQKHPYAVLVQKGKVFIDGAPDQYRIANELEKIILELRQIHADETKMFMSNDSKLSIADFDKLLKLDKKKMKEFEVLQHKSQMPPQVCQIRFFFHLSIPIFLFLSALSFISIFDKAFDKNAAKTTSKMSTEEGN